MEKRILIENALGICYDDCCKNTKEKASVCFVISKDWFIVEPFFVEVYWNVEEINASHKNRHHVRDRRGDNDVEGCEEELDCGGHFGLLLFVFR